MRYKSRNFKSYDANKKSKPVKLEEDEVEVVEIQSPKANNKKSKNFFSDILGNFKSDDLILILMLIIFMTDNKDKDKDNDDDMLIPILIYILLD